MTRLLDASPIIRARANFETSAATVESLVRRRVPHVRRSCRCRYMRTRGAKDLHCCMSIQARASRPEEEAALDTACQERRRFIDETLAFINGTISA